MTTEDQILKPEFPVTGKPEDEQAYQEQLEIYNEYKATVPKIDGAIFIADFAGKCIREKVMMKEPDQLNYYEYDPIDPGNPEKIGFDIDRFNEDCKVYSAYIASRRTYPYPVSKEQDGKELRKGIDFEIVKKIISNEKKKTPNGTEYNDAEYIFVAIPIEPDDWNLTDKELTKMGMEQTSAFNEPDTPLKDKGMKEFAFKNMVKEYNGSLEQYGIDNFIAGYKASSIDPSSNDQKFYDAVILKDRIVEFIETSGKKLLPSTKSEILAMICESFPSIHPEGLPDTHLQPVKDEAQKTLWSTIWSMAHSMKAYEFGEYFRKQYQLSSPPEPSSKEQEGYWKKRCEAAEDYISTDCEPITKYVSTSFAKWQELKNKKLMNKEQPIKGWVKATFDNMPEKDKQIVVKKYDQSGKLWYASGIIEDYAGEVRFKYDGEDHGGCLIHFFLPFEFLDETPIQSGEERLFTLKEALDIWSDGFEAGDGDDKTVTQYFKEKFNIDL